MTTITIHSRVTWIHEQRTGTQANPGTITLQKKTGIVVCVDKSHATIRRADGKKCSIALHLLKPVPTSK